VKKVFYDLEIDESIIEMVHEYSNKALEILAEIPIAQPRKVELEKFTRNLMDRIR
jgi:geranylgeranyl pyrophosphate synthase